MRLRELDMNEESFRALAEEDPRTRVDLLWCESRNGWIIMGPMDNIYTVEGAVRVFEKGALAEVHRILGDWGFTRFFQEQVLKAFPEDGLV
jgi:hypothetical protein